LHVKVELFSITVTGIGENMLSRRLGIARRRIFSRRFISPDRYGWNSLGGWNLPPGRLPMGRKENNHPEIEAMNVYEVTFTNGEVVVIAAWTPETAQAFAEETADLYGCQGLSAVTVTLVRRIREEMIKPLQKVVEKA
jgi:hypothetical protein